LTLDGLNLFLAQLAAANKATNDADKAWADAVSNRDACLQGPENSVYSVVRDIKLELIGMEGRQGANYKKVETRHALSLPKRIHLLQFTVILHRLDTNIHDSSG
jgi:hypothetical protein